jgi:hypothetical protein
VFNRERTTTDAKTDADGFNDDDDDDDDGNAERAFLRRLVVWSFYAYVHDRRCDTSGRSRITSWVMRRRSVSRLDCVENTEPRVWRRRRMDTGTGTRRDRWTRGMRF